VRQIFACRVVPKAACDANRTRLFRIGPGLSTPQFRPDGYAPNHRPACGRECFSSARRYAASAILVRAASSWTRRMRPATNPSRSSLRTSRSVSQWTIYPSGREPWLRQEVARWPLLQRGQRPGFSRSAAAARSSQYRYRISAIVGQRCEPVLHQRRLPYALGISRHFESLSGDARGAHPAQSAHPSAAIAARSSGDEGTVTRRHHWALTAQTVWPQQSQDRRREQTRVVVWPSGITTCLLRTYRRPDTNTMWFSLRDAERVTRQMAPRSSRHRIRPIAVLALEAVTTIGPRRANVHLAPVDRHLHRQAGYMTAPHPMGTLLATPRSTSRRSPYTGC
jgi:hypothetical protein